MRKMRRKGKRNPVRSFAVILLAFILTGVPALAGETEPDTRNTGETDGQAHLDVDTVHLDIDTEHLYEHMDMSYSQGYVPKVENGVVYLVVPFLSSGALRQNRLTVELDMGENAPFVYANYRKEVLKGQFLFAGSAMPVEAYIFCCEIRLENRRRNGKYPVTVRAVGYSEAGQRAELGSRIFITVTDGAEPPEPGTENAPGQTDSSGSGAENVPGQTDSPGSGAENAPGQTDSPGSDTEDMPGQTEPPGSSAENTPGQTEPPESGTEEPPLLVPDDPGTNGDFLHPADGDVPPNAGETDPGQPVTETAATEVPLTETVLPTEPLTEETEQEKSEMGEELQEVFGGGESGGSAGSYGGNYGGGVDSDSSAEKIHRQPKFLLLSQSLDGEQLTAGQEYAFTAVFQNMTGDEPVYNMKATLGSESESIGLGCTSFYFGKVRAQETISLPTFLSVKPNAQEGKAAVTITLDYENDQGTAYTMAEVVELDIYQPSQVVLEGFRLAAQVYATDTVEGSFAIHNAGKAAVYNVRVEFAGRGLFATGDVFAGNLEAGASYEGVLRIYVGSKAMESLADAGTDGNNVKHSGQDDTVGELYGQTAGTLTLTYEDAYGETYRQTQEFATEILEPRIVELSVEKTEEQTNQWQAAILLLMGVLFVLIVVLMGWRLRRSRNALADLLAAQRERSS